MVFQKIFGRKLEAGEILFQGEGSQNVHKQPFLNHRNGKGNGQLLMSSIVDKDKEMFHNLRLS